MNGFYTFKYRTRGRKISNLHKIKMAFLLKYINKVLQYT